MKPHSEKFLQKRRFLLVLPLLVLPFVTMLFWALGGGQGSAAKAYALHHDGLNLSLPEAYFGGKEVWDKLTLYEMAERDSAKYKEARERDPYFDLVAFKSQQELQPPADTTKKGSKLIDAFPHKERTVADPNEERVNKKLQELYAEINKPVAAQTTTPAHPATPSTHDPNFTADVDRLERMMELMHESREVDPEMQQIESVLEKILDIQHPERVKEKLKATSAQHHNGKHTLPVRVPKHAPVSLIGTDSVEPEAFADSAAVTKSLPRLTRIQNGFFGLDDEILQEDEQGNVIEAVIHDTQELVAGSTVRMRLLNEIVINGRLVSKDQFIHGVCAINGERLAIEITSVRAGKSLLPVALKVYDLDGLPGIYVPGAISRDAAKQASDNALQNLQLMTLDPSIGAQAAAAGVEAAKGLFSKKAKLVKVTVKAGYQVFLKDTNATSVF
jgi:conjugative transposon TraM protein